MDNMMAVQAMGQPISRSLLGLAQGETGVPGDAFSMIFAQLMGGEAEDSLAAALMQMTGQLQQDEEDMGILMAAEMLCTMPGFQPQMLLNLLQDGGMETSPAVQEVLQNVMQNTASPKTVQGLADLVQTVETAEEEEPSDLLTAKDDGEFVEILSKAWSQEKTETPVTRMGLDHSVVRAIRETLKQEKKETVETPDIDALQADVNAKRFMPAETTLPVSEQPKVPDGEEIAAQVKTGILENVAKGKNEFVVKLKPEGIGEIVVKFTENRDKIALTIFTTNTQTARLISNEIASLQSALRPLQAEVQEIVVTPDGQAAQYSAQNQMTDQGRQFYDQQPSHQGEHSHHSMNRESSFEETVETVLDTDEMLNTYI